MAVCGSVCECVCVGYACFALFAQSLWKWKFALVFLCAHLVNVCETVKSRMKRSFCSRSCCCCCFCYLTLCCAQQGGEGEGGNCPLLRCCKLYAFARQTAPHVPSFSPRFAPFLLATRILSALLFFPSRILSLFLPFCLLFIIHLLWNWINFCLVAHSLFWHSNAFGTYVSLFWLVYCTQQIDMCSNGSHKMCNARWRTPRRPATFGEFAFWIVEKAISLFCQAIHWKVSSGKHSAHSSHSSHPSLWLSTKAFKVLWNLFYSHFIFSGDFLAFFLSLFSISIHFPLCCSYSRWRNAKIMIKMAVCLLLVRILLFIWKLCEKSRARQTESETETDKGHRLCGAFQ